MNFQVEMKTPEYEDGETDTLIYKWTYSIQPWRWNPTVFGETNAVKTDYLNTFQLQNLEWGKDSISSIKVGIKQ